MDVGGRQRGFTLIELVIVVAIVGILASAALPLARWSVKRGKEHELQQNLRILRHAIDRYRDAAEAGLIEVAEGDSGYPPSLEVLVEGVPLIGPMPPLAPAASDEYAASGPGLTGGLRAQLQEGQEQLGVPGTGGAPGAAVAGGRGAGAPGQSSILGGGGATGLRQQGGLSGRSGASGQFGAQRPGMSSGFGQRQGSSGFGSSGFGSSGFGQRQGSSGFGSTGFGAQAGGPGQQGQPAEPLLGPDGQAIKLILLRRLPIDPFTGAADWGRRCYGEPPEDRLWCGRDVFDVYSKSFAKAIDGTSYKDW